MSDETEIEPWLSGPRWSRSYTDCKYLSAVLAVAARSGGIHGSRARVFRGVRLGRGKAAAAALRMAGRNRAVRSRQGIVKTKVAVLGPHRMSAAFAHMRYISRDGVTRTGERGSLYSAQNERADGRSFLDRCRDDRHQFRITVSPADGEQYEDLRPLVRRFMGRLEDDLGTSLEWVAADHCDTAHHHAHIVLRGKADCGQDLVIAPDYLTRGMRQRLITLLSIDLGPPNEFDINRSRQAEVGLERLTRLDQQLMQGMDEDRVILVRGRDMPEHCLFNARLQKLGALGLAERLSSGRWRLGEDLEAALDALGRRMAATRTMSSELRRAGLERPITQRVIHMSDASLELTGRMVGEFRPHDGTRSDHLLIDALDGRSHYVNVGQDCPQFPLPDEAIVRLRLLRARNGPECSVDIDLLSSRPIADLPSSLGATWLDRELISPTIVPRDAGFGREVRAALERRRIWLVEQGFARAVDGGLMCRADMLAILEQHELTHAAAAIRAETGLFFAAADERTELDGIVRRRVDLVSGCYAMIDDGSEFTLVPWQPLFDERLGEAVRAISAPDGSSWRIGRGRGIQI